MKVHLIAQAAVTHHLHPEAATEVPEAAVVVLAGQPVGAETK
jgi:hypothetical protein